MKKLVRSTLVTGFLAIAADAVAHDWMAQAREACTLSRQSTAECERATQLVRDALDATRPGAAPNGNGNGSSNTHDLDAAAEAVAAYVVLERLFPDQQPHFENRLAIALASYPESQAKADALAHGRRTAESFLAAMAKR